MTGPATGAPARLAVEAALDTVRPLLTGHLGSVEVETITPAGEVQLAFGGTCDGCPVLPVTFAAVVEPRVFTVPGVTAVTSRQMNASRHAVDRIRSMHHLPDPAPRRPDTGRHLAGDDG